MRKSALTACDALPVEDVLGGYTRVTIKGIWQGLLKEPAYFWWLCIYLFFEYVRPQSIYTWLDLLPWAKVSIVLAFIQWFFSPEKQWIGSRLTAPIVLFFIITVLSSVAATYPSYAFANMTVQVNWLLLFVVFVGIVNSPRRFFVVLLLFLLASFKMSQHASISWASRGFSFARWGVAGAPGWFGNAADLGVQMLIFAPLASAFVLALHTQWGIFKRLFFWSFPVTGVMAIIATGERGTILGLVAMCGSATLFSKYRLRSLLAMLVIGASVFYAMPEEFKSRFHNMEQDGTAVSRLTYWKRGFDMVADHPVLGIGYNNWVPYYMEYYPGESLRADHQEVAHSTPITVLAELGGVGAAAYLWIVFRVLLVNRASIRLASMREEKLYAYVAYALNLGLVGFLTAGVFVTVAYYPFLWMQACFSASLFQIINNERQSPPIRYDYNRRINPLSTIEIAKKPSITD